MSNERAATGKGRDRGLLAIGLFKLLKSMFFFGVGIGAIHLIQKDLGDEAMRLATRLGFEPEGRFVTLVMEKANLIDAHRLREIGFFTFAYSGLALIEGVGLMLEKGWAEYLTLTLTTLALPWEVFEICREPSLFRVGLLVINLAVLWYLLWILKKKKRNRKRLAPVTVSP